MFDASKHGRIRMTPAFLLAETSGLSQSLAHDPNPIEKPQNDVRL